MALDATEIANGALALLGEDPISDIEDPDNPSAVKLDRVYTSSLEYCLVNHDWGCATHWDTASALNDTPPPSYDSVWQLPATPRLLKIQLVRLQDVDRPLRYQRLAKQRIATRLDTSETLWIRYTYKPPINEIEPHIVNYLEHYLAWRTCMPITAKVDLTALMKRQRDEAWAEAKRIEAHAGGSSKKADLTRLTRRKGGPNWPEGTDQSET